MDYVFMIVEMYGCRAEGGFYSGATEKWHRQPFEQSPLFKGLEEKSYAIFWGSGYSAHAVAICGAGEKPE